MANSTVNKVQLGSEVLIDISDTTAVATDVTAGKYFYAANGQKTSGSLSFSTIYTSSSNPSSSQGSNGDIWLVTS